MKKLIATTLIAIALSTPAMAFDISGIDGLPANLKDAIAKQSGGRITNNQAGQGQQQAGLDGQQQQQGRQASRKKQGSQDRATTGIDQLIKGDTSGFGGLGQGLGSFR